MVRRIALGLACVAAVAAGASRLDAGDRRVAVRGPGHQVQYDDQRGVAYSLSHVADGGIRLSGRSPELTFDKTSYADGHFDLRIESGGDVASFAVGAAGTTVSRSGRTAIVGLAPTEQDFEGARTLLAGSRAVKRYRQLAASVEQSDEASPASHGLLIGASVVHLLDGDPGAPSRLARRLATRRPPAALRHVAAIQDPSAGGSSEDCWLTYETRVNQAYRDFWDCMRTRQYWNYDIIQYACSGVWTVRVEGYWFQYLKCSSFA